jgi:DNA-binding MarR family transcriptional regulator
MRQEMLNLGIRSSKGRTVDEATKWVLGVDRRVIVMRALDSEGAFSASDIAGRIGRSVQNVSRAIDEMEAKGLVECLTPEKHSWKRYLLTDRGRAVIDELRSKKLIP